MKTPVIASIAAGLALGLLACQPAENDDRPDVEQFRAAIPSMNQIAAPAPEASTSASNAVGELALYPQAAYPVVIGINGTVAITIVLMKAITALPPTVYNSDTNEYVWGPFPNDEGVGYVAVYVKDNGPASGEDFRFEYGFLRGIDNDIANLTPVILGGANPDLDNDDLGSGVVVWDAEASRAFDEQHDPAFDEMQAHRGRFASAYFSGIENGESIKIVVAALNGFEDPSDADFDPNGAGKTLRYMWGEVEGDTDKVAFVDVGFPLDVDEPADGIDEDIGMRMAFLNDGFGRAEADATGGSLGTTGRGDVVECWDTSLTETYLAIQITDNGEVVEEASEGIEANCGLFTATLDDLGVPSYEDIDEDIRLALEHVAENGVGE